MYQMYQTLSACVILGKLFAAGDLLLELAHEDGREDTDDAQSDEYPADNGAEENADVALRGAQCVSEALFAYGSKYQCKNNGCGVEVEFTHEVTDDTEGKHNNDVQKVSVDGEGANEAENGYAGDEDGVAEAGNLGEAAAAEKADTQHEELDENETCKEGVGHVGVLGEKFGTGLETLNDKTAHQNSGDALAGNTKGKGGDERAAGNCVVGSFGACDAFDGAVAKLFLMLTEALGIVITHEAGNGCACAGENTDEVTDNPGTENGGPKETALFLVEHDLIGELAGLGALLDLLLGKDKYLAHGEKTDEGAGGVDAFCEVGLAKHEALAANDGVKADGAKEKTQSAGHKTLDYALAGNAGDNGKSKEAEPEILGGHELKSQLCKKGSEEIKGNAAEQTTPEGAPAGGGQSLTCLTLKGHLVTFNGSCSRCGSAGSVNEDGGNGAAEDGAAVDSAENDEAGVSLHGEGEGEHQSNAHCGGKAGKAADDDTKSNTKSHGEKVCKGKGMSKAAAHRS